MAHSICVINTKGGVGKTTLVLGLAECLAVHYKKRILVIDADSQASVSYSFCGAEQLARNEESGNTIVDWVHSNLLTGGSRDWRDFVSGPVSDVDECKTIWLLASDSNLTLLEREISRKNIDDQFNEIVKSFLVDAKDQYDFVIIDCPPGISVVTEGFLQAADYHIIPTRPDFVSCLGLTFLKRFQEIRSRYEFARNLGVVVSMKDSHSQADATIHKWLMDDASNKCFETFFLYSRIVQGVTSFVPGGRSWSAKYPGEVGEVMKRFTIEVLKRLGMKVEATR